MMRAWMLAARSSTTAPRPLLYPLDVNLYPNYPGWSLKSRGEKEQDMRRISPGSAVALAAIGLALAVAGCGSGNSSGGGSTGGGGAPNSGTVQKGGTLTVALAEDPDQLDPTLARTFVGRIVFANLCEKLYDVDASLNVVPQLAAGMPKFSNGGKTVTIKIRQGLKFNDGTTLDAQAVKTSLDRHRKLPDSARASELAPVTSVKVVNPTTVQLTLDQAFAPLTSLLADRSGMIMSPAQLKKLGDKFSNDPVCVGPFQFVSRSEGDQIVLKKAPDYYDASKVKLDKLVFKIITEPSARAANLRSGDVDVAERLDGTDTPAIKSDSSLQLLTRTSLGYQGLTINVGNANGLGKPYHTVDTPLGQHKELRQALGLSIDPGVITRVALQGAGVPGCSPISPVSPWHDPNLKCPGRDLAKAKQLVAQSGVKTPIPVSLMIGAGNATQQRVGQAIQAMAKEAGFAVKLQPTEFTAQLDKQDAGTFDTSLIGWSGRVDPDGNIHEFVDTKGSLNDSGYSSPQMDKLLDQSRTTLDQNKRKQIYSQIQQILDTDAPLLYIWHDKLFTGASRKVQGMQFYGDGLLRLKEAGLTG
jgi:peptide/nickel transport system substrate-binding protein